MNCPTEPAGTRRPTDANRPCDMGSKERREREKKARRRQILDAARDLLLEKGLTQISINQIAKRAELGVGTIYFYYQNKEELFARLQEEGLSLLHQQVSKACREANGPREALSASAMAYLDFSVSHKDYFDIINYFLSSPEIILREELKQRVDGASSTVLELIIDVIRTGVARSVFHTEDPRKYAIMLWGTLHGLLQFRKLETTALKEESHRGIYDFAVEQLIDGLRPCP